MTDDDERRPRRLDRTSVLLLALLVAGFAGTFIGLALFNPLIVVPSLALLLVVGVTRVAARGRRRPPGERSPPMEERDAEERRRRA